VQDSANLAHAFACMHGKTRKENQRHTPRAGTHLEKAPELDQEPAEAVGRCVRESRGRVGSRGQVARIKRNCSLHQRRSHGFLAPSCPRRLPLSLPVVCRRIAGAGCFQRRHEAFAKTRPQGKLVRCRRYIQCCSSGVFLAAVLAAAHVLCLGCQSVRIHGEVDELLCGLLICAP
jgi:hypothetical protein